MCGLKRIHGTKGVQSILQVSVTELTVFSPDCSGLRDKPRPVCGTHRRQIKQQHSTVHAVCLRSRPAWQICVPRRLLRDGAKEGPTGLERREVLPQSGDVCQDHHLRREHNDAMHGGQQICREQRQRGALGGGVRQPLQRRQRLLCVHVARLYRLHGAAAGRPWRARRRQRTACGPVGDDVQPQRNGAVEHERVEHRARGLGCRRATQHCEHVDVLLHCLGRRCRRLQRSSGRQRQQSSSG